MRCYLLVLLLTRMNIFATTDKYSFGYSLIWFRASWNIEADPTDNSNFKDRFYFRNCIFYNRFAFSENVCTVPVRQFRTSDMILNKQMKLHDS